MSKVNATDLLYDDIDQRIVARNGNICSIQLINEIYMLVPTSHNIELLYPEIHSRKLKSSGNVSINLNSYLKSKTKIFDYEKERLKIKSKYDMIPLEELSKHMLKISECFHSRFIEETIVYMFNTWTNPFGTHKSEMHEFYIKMLYYYDNMGLIVWAKNINATLKQMYKDYILEVIEDKKTEGDNEDESIISSHSVSSSIKSKVIEHKNIVKLLEKHRSSVKKTMSKLPGNKNKKLDKTSGKNKVSLYS